MAKRQFDKLDQGLVLPLAAYLLALSCLRILTMGRTLFFQSETPSAMDAALNLFWAVLSILLLVVALRGEKIRFYRLSAGFCVLLTLMQGILIFIDQTVESSLSTSLIAGILSFDPFILALLLMLRYQKSLVRGKPEYDDILPFLGIIMLIEGLLPVMIPLMAAHSFNVSAYPLIQILIGIGLLARDRFLGLFGAFAWIVIPVFAYPFAAVPPGPETVMILVQSFLFRFFVFVLVWRVRENGFKRNSLSAVFGALPASVTRTKNCGSCGKPVPLSSAVGQRCPHCGAYWGAERTVNKN